jgi:hypothetical protein
LPAYCAGQRYPLRDQDIIQLGPDTQLQVAIEAAAHDAAGLTVEQKLTADAQRIAASIQVGSACKLQRQRRPAQCTAAWQAHAKLVCLY